MKLIEYGDEILFDEFPKTYVPEQKIFLTHLYNMQALQFPKTLPKLYTSKHLAAQFTLYMKLYRNIELTSNQFVILPIFEPILVRLNNVSHLRVLACQTDDASRNLMVLMKKDGKLTHLYAGMCTNIRNIVMNDKFAKWISNGVNKLFIYTERAKEICNPREMNECIDKIENLLERTLTNHQSYKLRLHLPILGYENFIAHIACRLLARVILSTELRKLNETHMDMQYFQKEACDAKIIISCKGLNLKQIKLCQKNEHSIDFVFLVDKSLHGNEITTPNEKGYYEMQWSPIPTPFELRLLAALVYPEHILSITHQRIIPDRVPDYLMQYLNRNRQRTPINKKQQQQSILQQQAQPKYIDLDKPQTNDDTTPRITSQHTITKNMNTVAMDITPTLRKITKKLHYLEESDTDSS